MSTKKFLAMICLSLGVSACSSLPSPKTFAEKELYAITMVDSIEKGTITLLQAKAISVNDAKQVEASRNVAMQGIKVAEGYEAAAPGSGATKLESAIAILTAAQSYLISRGASK